MALDFPNSPVAGQIFGAPNGITYIYDTALPGWKVYSAYGSPGGDFYATNTGNISTVGGVVTLLVLNTVGAGNSGGWYSTSTGKFTPPAGRYYLAGGYSAFYASAAVGTYCQLFKNGVLIPGTYSKDTSGAANYYANPSAYCTVDANGSDVFDLRYYTGSACTIDNAWFLAYPILSQTPTPPLSAWRSLGIVNVSSAVASVDFTNLPTDVAHLKFSLDITPVSSTQDLCLQFYDGTGTLDTTSTHYTSACTYALSSATGGAPVAWGIPLDTKIILSVPASGQRVGNTLGVRCNGTIQNIRDAARYKNCNFQTSYRDTTDNTILRTVVGSGDRNVAGMITGLRFLFGGSNIASGTVELWGSP